MGWIAHGGTKLDFRVFEESLLGPILAQGKHGKIELDLGTLEFVDLTGIVPLIALLRKFQGDGVSSTVALPTDDFLYDYFKKAGWTDAIIGNEPPPHHGPTYTRLQAFTAHEELNRCIDDAMDVLARVSEFPEGVLRGIKWTLDEITDNVLVHAGGSPGWVQLISRPKTNHVHIVVADCGFGIAETIRQGFPDLADDVDALRVAVERGTTRDTSIGQGNGLAGSLRVSQALRGYVNILSGSACLRQNPQGHIEVHDTSPFPGTVATLTVATDAEIDIASALWGEEGGYEPARPFEYSHIEYDGIVFRVKDESSGFGNRASGEALVNKLRNIALGSPEERVIIDFDNVELASASFLDEFIAKLIRREGVASFFGRYSFRNVNDLLRRTLDQVINQRLSSKS